MGDLNQDYTFLLLMGHWERDYRGAVAGDEYKYNEDVPPTLFASGYVKTNPAREREIPITMHPLAVRVNKVFPRRGGRP
jgi:hypothetical protein